MALNAKNIPNKSNSDRVPQASLEPGTYPARVVQILDLGLQPQRPYQGQDKPPANEIMITYELVDVFLVDENGEEVEDKPRWISETLPIHSLEADLAKSTKRYRALDPDEVYEGDFSKLVDTPCSVTIVVNKKGDKVYENVANVSTMRARDAAKCPELKNEVKVFDLSDPDMAVFGKLPKWLQEKITSNLEFKGSPLEAALSGAPSKEKKDEKPSRSKPAKKEEPAFDPDEQDEDDDNNPY